MSEDQGYPHENDNQDGDDVLTGDELAHRLIDLTELGRLTWKYFYGSSFTDADSFEEATLPTAYVLDDGDFGFGVVAVVLQDRINESYDPVLFIQGQRVDVSMPILTALIDFIRMHFEDVQIGRLPTAQERFQEMVKSQVEPYLEQVDFLQNRIARYESKEERYMNQVDKLLGMVTVGASSTTEAAVPFTAETLKEALRYIVGPGYDEAFEQHYDDKYCADVVSHVVAQYNNSQ